MYFTSLHTVFVSWMKKCIHINWNPANWVFFQQLSHYLFWRKALLMPVTTSNTWRLIPHTVLFSINNWALVLPSAKKCIHMIYSFRLGGNVLADCFVHIKTLGGKKERRKHKSMFFTALLGLIVYWFFLCVAATSLPLCSSIYNKEYKMCLCSWKTVFCNNWKCCFRGSPRTQELGYQPTIWIIYVWFVWFVAANHESQHLGQGLSLHFVS